MNKKLTAANERHNDPMLTVAQVCERLGDTARSTFYDWRQAGIAPDCVELPNRRLLIFESDLMRWIDQRREKR